METVRSIKKSIYLLPNEGNKKVYILCGAQKMSRSAQNALLKFFEEPPASAAFIICCDRRDALLPTVLSRALLISLGPLHDEALRSYLADRHRAELPERLDAAVRYAQGSIGRAEAFLTPASQEALRAATDFCTLLFEKNGTFSLAAQLLPLSAKRDGFDAFLTFAVLEPAATQTYRASSTRRALCFALDAFADARANLAANANGRLTATQLCARLASL